jgi:hypothetical protein
MTVLAHHSFGFARWANVTHAGRCFGAWRLNVTFMGEVQFPIKHEKYGKTSENKKAF